MAWTLGVCTVWAAASADEGSRGRYIGVYNLSFATAFVAAPLVGTWVYERVSGTARWLGCGVAGVVVALGYLTLGRSRS